MIFQRIVLGDRQHCRCAVSLGLMTPAKMGHETRMCTEDAVLCSAGLSMWSTFVMAILIAGRTFLPARTHRASRSTALVSLRPRSIRRASSLAFSVGRPGSKLGDAMGLNSTLNLKDPSFGLTKAEQQWRSALTVPLMQPYHLRHGNKLAIC